MRKTTPLKFEDTLTIADIASLAGCSTATVARKMRRPGFPQPLFAPHVARRKVFDRSEVMRWLRGEEARR